jgi:GDP-D-mannose 3', 5'-epimerase
MNGASRYLFSSSACVYPDHLQSEANVAPLKEEDAYPASPQDAYGWERLVAERLCRKVAAVEPGEEIEVWGDGEQTRSSCCVDDCVEGIYRLMESDYREPLNLGSVMSRRPPWAAAGR